MPASKRVANRSMKELVLTPYKLQPLDDTYSIGRAKPSNQGFNLTFGRVFWRAMPRSVSPRWQRRCAKTGSRRPRANCPDAAISHQGREACQSDSDVGCICSWMTYANGFVPYWVNKHAEPTPIMAIHPVIWSTAPGMANNRKAHQGREACQSKEARGRSTHP